MGILKEKKLIHLIPKNYNGMLTHGLYHYEFKCKCSYDSCTTTLVGRNLIGAYGKLRIAFGKPLRINSGFRCQKHNEDEGGKSTSWHQLGHAIDISMSGMSESEKKRLIKLAKKFFTFVKVYDNFIHCHMEG